MVQCVTIICKRGSNTLFLHFVFFLIILVLTLKKNSRFFLRCGFELDLFRF